MKTKKIFAAGLALSMLLGAASGLTACGEHTHELSAVEKKAATCTEAGYEAYYKCSGCDKLFSDDKGETEITKPTEIPAGHKIEEVAKKDATCTAEGAATHYKCTACNKLFSDAAGKNVITAATPIPVADHTLVDVSEKRPTCTEAGYEEHYKCSDCGALFADEEGATPIEEPTAIPATHRLTLTERRAATCVEDGYEAYYTCSGCNKLYSDAQATAEITEPVVISKTGIHTPGFAYTSETVPAPVAEGGTLDSKCVVCGEEMGIVNYNVGLSVPKVMKLKNAVELSGANTYYYQLGTGLREKAYFKFHAVQAGTYTFTFTNVYGEENLHRVFKELYIKQDSYPALGDPALMENNSWGYGAEADVQKYRPKVDIEGYVDNGKNAPLKLQSPLTKVTFTFTDEDVANGGLYIAFGIFEHVLNDSDSGVEPTTPGAYLIKFETPAEETQA